MLGLGAKLRRSVAPTSWAKPSTTGIYDPLRANLRFAMAAAPSSLRERLATHRRAYALKANASRKSKTARSALEQLRCDVIFLELAAELLRDRNLKWSASPA